MPALNEPVYEDPRNERKLSRYERVMVPLMDEPETWAKIGEYRTKDSAYQAFLNLRQARYQIPGEPDDWEFLPEDNFVYARYKAQNKVANKK